MKSRETKPKGFTEKFGVSLKYISTDCIYCGFSKLKVINGTFPTTYECLKCKKIFIEPNPMIM
ncbi:MAG: hypothetical protein N3E38_01385 [Candidatus Aenigmarchaeota archaeon]|nr:hypothetical protein [Candidatus Aenigmarchaeota archaeon]